MRTKIFALFVAVLFTGSMFAATEMTCAQAREAALGGSTDEVTVTGYVTSIQTAYNAQYNNLTFWMADEVDGGKVFQAYRCIPESADKLPEVGNLVKATGTLYNFNGNTPELAQGCTCVIVENDTPGKPCITASGTCGENLTWELSCDSVLTISGTGEMADYEYNTVPWLEHRSVINSVIIDEGVTSIGYYAFVDCHLLSVTIPNSVTVIKGRAFEDCSGLTSITIPNSVTYIAEYAFVGSYDLTSVIIPNSVYSIGQAAFGSCQSLISINVAADNPNYCSVDGVLFNKEKTTIMQFPAGKNEQSYSIPNSVTVIYNRAFTGCEKLKDLTIPNSVTRIEQCAFGGCGFTTITLPVGITSIDYYTFSRCGSLSSVTIPNGVTDIRDDAFGYCSNLNSVTNYATTPQEINSNVFYRVDISACTLYVPAESLEAYKTADVWKDFGTILPIEEVEKDYISIAEAIEIGMALDSMATSAETYTIEGYVINADDFIKYYMDQSWYMADDMDATSSDFQAYRCYPIYGEDTVEVTNGSKVRMAGKLLKYYNRSTEKYIVEMKQVPATILSWPQKDTITVAQALEIGSALESMEVTEKEYVIKGYVSNIVVPYDTLYKNETFWITDEKGARTSDKTQAFEIYRGKPNTEMEIGLDALIQIQCKIRNYNGTIENNGVNVIFEVLEQAVIEIPDTITVAQALEIGSTLESMAVTEKEYVIKGYVSNIITPYDTIYKNETFMITDVKGARTNDITQAFEIYRGRPNTQKEIGLDAYIQIKCRIKNYKGIIENEIANQSFEVLEQGIIDDNPDSCIIASGTCGENLTWKLSCDSVLTISGTGEMTYNTIPWLNYRSAIKSVIIEEGVTSIGKRAFGWCDNLFSVTISSTIINIGIEAFYFSDALISINVASTNANYSSLAGVLFNKDQTTLIHYPAGKTENSYTIPSTVKTIGDDAFTRCVNLTNIIIPNSVTRIGSAGIRYCYNLTSISIPNSVTSIGSANFWDCSRMSSIDVANDNPNYSSIDGVLFNKEQTLLILYPRGKEGDSYAIPNTVTTIERCAFSASRLYSITIPSSVIDILPSAFTTFHLNSVTNYATEPQTIDVYVFGQKDLSTCTLYVPTESLDAYKAADVWKDFGTILPIEAPVETEEVDFNVVYKGNDGSQISSEMITLHLPVAPEIEGFSFLKWEVVTGDLEDGIVIQAVYTSNEQSALSVVVNPSNPAQKLIRNGNVYILTGDKIYTIQGHEVR